MDNAANSFLIKANRMEEHRRRDDLILDLGRN